MQHPLLRRHLRRGASYHSLRKPISLACALSLLARFHCQRRWPHHALLPSLSPTTSFNLLDLLTLRSMRTGRLCPTGPSSRRRPHRISRLRRPRRARRTGCRHPRLRLRLSSRLLCPLSCFARPQTTGHHPMSAPFPSMTGSRPRGPHRLRLRFLLLLSKQVPWLLRAHPPPSLCQPLTLQRWRMLRRTGHLLRRPRLAP